MENQNTQIVTVGRMMKREGHTCVITLILMKKSSQNKMTKPERYKCVIKLIISKKKLNVIKYRNIVTKSKKENVVALMIMKKSS